MTDDTIPESDAESVVELIDTTRALLVKGSTKAIMVLHLDADGHMSLALSIAGGRAARARILGELTMLQETILQAEKDNERAAALSRAMDRLAALDPSEPVKKPETVN